MIHEGLDVPDVYYGLNDYDVCYFHAGLADFYYCDDTMCILDATTLLLATTYAFRRP
jgi:hypothetical protein